MNAAQLHLDFLTSGYLRSLDSLPASVVNSLETAPPPAAPGSSTAIHSAAAVSAQAPATVEPPKQKKTRISRVPKGVVPGVTPPPDPERWIKRSERSTFGQGQGRRRKTGGGGATQGSTADSSPAYNLRSSATGSKQKKKK